MAKKYELLAPVGDFPMLTAAVNAGADAVYFGLQEFTMRKGSKNFRITDLPKMRKICGKRIKMYLTLNTIIYDNELKKLEEIIKESKKYIDAVICWDLSVINLCKKHKISFHISTQASISNSEAAKFYKKLGAERIVLARELNLKQVKDISKIIPIECFAHGAMCVSISGRCFTSQFLFNKSANRGECIQPCRRSYIVRDKQEGYELKINNDKVLSAKDLCTLPFIEQMKKAGIKSFKIEGRNRDPKYVDAVIRVYRKALDKKLPQHSSIRGTPSGATNREIKQCMKELEKVYNRGFSSGFYLGSPTPDDFARIEHSAATEKKHFVGKITHYYPKIKVATIKLVSELKIGDDIIIIGKTTGLEKSKIKHIEIKHKSVSKARKGDEIGIKLLQVRKNDEVFLIKK
ncbi:putative protease YhbU precursor [archaeon BMS3Abin17]|nr:putative protease YhbU precursor [archaeon BMS3Abin17]HDZ60478.1 U32 family peptidase [Candidatus Pacearchaeota archaeon]